MAQTGIKKTFRQRSMGHGTLILLSLVFLLPFAWLLATSFKADDDLMEIPKDLKVFIPKGRFAAIEGQVQRVTLGKGDIDYPAKIVRWLEGPDKGQTKLVAASEIKGGKLKKWVDQAGQPVGGMFQVTTAKDIPGSPEHMYKRVEQYKDDPQEEWQPKWDCVPESEVSVRFAPRLANYSDGLKKKNFARFYLTTAMITVAFVFLMVLSCSFTAYGFGILQWRGRDVIFFVMLCTMMLPGHVTLIPVFILFKHLGWINTFRPLVFPAIFGSAFFIFLLRQFYLTIPGSLLDAARIDGCSELRIWWQLIVPLSKPALMTVGLFSFLHAWNDFLGPLVYITSEKKYTLSLGLAMFQGQYGSEYGMLMAMTVLTIIPILVLFFFAQKTFIQGVKLSGIKE